MGRRKEKHGGKVAELSAKKPTVMRFLIDELEEFNDKLYTLQAEKYTWTAHFYRGQFYNEDYVVFDIYCHCHIPSWSCDATTEVKIWNKTIHKIEHHYELKRNCMSCPPFMKWKDLIAPENGHVQKGRVICEILISELPKRVQKNPAVIVKEYPGIRNLEISVGKSRFYVNQELLAFTSSFFHEELLMGKFDDGTYVLEDINAIDFKLYLDLTYHPKQYFSGYHAKDMLLIAKRLNNTEVVTTCQNVILEDLKECKLNNKDKAKLAEAYDLDTVRDLFSPETLLKPSSRPRFMPVEKYRDNERTSPILEDLGNILAEKLARHQQNNKCCGDDEIVKEKEEEIKEEVVEDEDYRRISRTDHLLMDADYDDDDDVQIIEDEREEEEVEEEEFDISIPSTSGCCY